MSALAFPASTLAAIVITLSFAAGLNVYLTVFSLGIMARLHWIALPDGLHALTNPWIMGVSGVLFAGEFFADKIPGFDLVWNALHTFVRIPVAALLAYAAGEHLTPEMHLLVTCAGAMFAAIAHGSKTALRVAVTPSPEPISNVGLSTAEDGIALGLSWLVMHHPLVAGTTVAVLSAAGVIAIWVSFKAMKAAIRALFSERTKVA
jgi:Domain of unknown function (DUF4126)